MIRPDGSQPSPFERRQEALRKTITSVAQLSMPERSDLRFDSFQVAGQAAELLKRDTAAGEIATLINDSIMTAAAGLFLSYLQDPPPQPQLGEKSRFENGLLKQPTVTAFRLGCLTTDTTTGYVSRVCQLVLSGTLAEKELTGVLRLNPSLLLLRGLSSRADQQELLAAALQECQRCLGAIMLAPSNDCETLEIVGWINEYSAPKLERFSPDNRVANEFNCLMDRVAYYREYQITDPTAAVGLELAASLKRATPMSCHCFMDLVLPIESQVALAYEGLFFRYTNNLRTANLGLKFAGEREGIGISAWSRLVNFLIGRAKQNFVSA